MSPEPPITELGLTIQFAEPVGIPIVELGRFHERFRREYPHVQQVPAAPPLTVEPGAALEFSMGGDPRLWFVSDDLHDLVQYQSDRMSQNWRRIGPLSDRPEYPGYRVVRDKFEKSIATLEQWCRENQKPLPVPAVGEVSYSNAVPTRLGERDVRISEVLSFFQPVFRATVVNFHSQWWERDEASRGWVHAICHAGATSNDERAIIITLIGRCDLRGSDMAGAYRQLDALRAHAHTMFARIVRPEFGVSEQK